MTVLLVLLCLCSLCNISTMAQSKDKQMEYLMDAISSMDLNPELESKDAAAKWLADLIAGGAKSKVMKQEMDVPPLPVDDQGQGHRENIVSPSTSSSYYVPKISIFSGSPQVPNGEVSFEQWIYEVEMLQREAVYKEQAIFQAVRRSLRGEAAKTARRLGSAVTLQQVLDKISGNYGDIAASEDLLATFYSAKQTDTETVTSWASRLEDILDKARTRCSLTQPQIADMLRTKFWRGLKKSLRDVTGHKFDSIMDYDKLRIAVRQIEQADSSPEKPKPVKVAMPHGDEMKEMKTLVKDLTTEMSKLKQDLAALQLNRKSTHNRQPAYRNFNSPSQKFGRQDKPFSDNVNGPVCWRCGQPGHMKRDCRVNLEHSRKSLNARMPTGLGHQ
ncbi:uncharacterized protein [Argopecten irradians]|uniref:uncharacterized protein n=1 Tax=Argopecten irradians TaxID=31199 RepID=UPI00372118E9